MRQQTTQTRQRYIPDTLLCCPPSQFRDRLYFVLFLAMSLTPLSDKRTRLTLFLRRVPAFSPKLHRPLPNHRERTPGLAVGLASALVNRQRQCYPDAGVWGLVRSDARREAAVRRQSRSRSTRRGRSRRGTKRAGAGYAAGATVQLVEHGVQHKMSVVHLSKILRVAVFIRLVSFRTPHSNP